MIVIAVLLIVGIGDMAGQGLGWSRAREWD